jgi:hypothetical protein
VSDARWQDVETDTSAAATHFARAVQIYRAGGLQDDSMDGYTRRMAFMHAMHAGHTSVEKVLLRILEMQGGETPTPRLRQQKKWRSASLQPSPPTDRQSRSVAGFAFYKINWNRG